MSRPMTSQKSRSFTESVIREMTRLCLAEHGDDCLNLAQGFPDFAAPTALKEAAVDAIRKDFNQYATTWGAKVMRDAIAAKTQHFRQMTVNPETEITVCCGVTEAMLSTILALVDPGDEVIIFEPFYENYGPDCILSGATPVVVPLVAPDWHFDRDQLRKAFNARTRAIIINTPHNPTGKVFSREELTFIAGLCQRYNAIAITDEVYEHILYDGAMHTRMATLPGMAERTLTISSLGKTFSVTGWKIGWAIGPAALVNAVNQAHQFITYAVASPLQAAAVTALNLPISFFEQLQMNYQSRRDRMVAVLQKVGFKVFKPSGSYFIMIDWRGVAPPHVKDDFQFARWLTTEIGVACIPASPFYQESDKYLCKHFARFAVCKKDETLAAAAERLSKLGKL